MEQIKPYSIHVGHGNDLASLDLSKDFYVKFPVLSREPLEPFEEAKIAAKEISKILGSDLTLCLSGGIDSEAMAIAFLAAGVTFTATTLRFLNGLNSEDIDCATEFCRHNNITQKFIDLDIADFLEQKKFLNHFKTYHCTSVETAVQVWFADRIKEPFVWGGEMMRLFLKDQVPKIQAMGEAEGNMYRFVEKSGVKAIPNFHFFSPELAWSFFKTSLLYKSIRYANDHSPEFYKDKLSFYNICGFTILDNNKRKRKLHGFEGIKKYIDELHRQKGIAGGYQETYRIPYQHLKIIDNFLEVPKNDFIAKKILHLATAAPNG